MTDYHFDRIARILSSAGSRRQTLAALAALALTRPISASAASQIETAACGEAGAVCTQVKGCCSGLVCATSTINTTYGVCVTGEGEMLPVSDDIVVPGAEGITDELAQEVTDASAGATDAESALDARATEMQSRQDARRTRIQTHRAKVRSRKDSNPLSSGTNDYTDYLDRLNRAPRLDLKWFHNADGTGESEILRVSNLGSVSVEVLRIASLQTRDALPLTITIPPEPGTWDLLSNSTEPDADGVTSWTRNDICPAAEVDDGDGVYLTVRQLGATRSHQLEVRCRPEALETSAVAAKSQHGKKTGKEHRDRKPSKRGKGR
jgi:hypothetical protein